MTKAHYTAEQIADLRYALYEQDVSLPAHIFPITSGGLGICFIAEKHVLKLFKTNSPTERTAIEQGYFRRANEALKNVSEIERKLNKRNIEVPKLLDHKEFSETIQFGDDRIHASQLMTRLEGRPFIRMLESLHPVNLAVEAADTIELAKSAARMHVQLGASGRQVSDGIYMRGNPFNWNDPIAWDESSHQILDRLHRDIADNSLPQDRVTLLHGDFHPENVLQSPKGYSIIDWDQQMYGRPEMDVWLFMSLRPQYMEQYCEAYNAIASQPLNETLVAGYGLTAATKAYSRHLKATARNNMDLGASQMPDLTASGFQLQMHELAKRLHQLTGHGIYADTAENYSNYYGLDEAPVNRSAPQLRLAGPKLGG